jgi:hypothetical protein
MNELPKYIASPRLASFGRAGGAGVFDATDLTNADNILQGYLYIF